MIFHTLVARQSANARLALALARLAVTTLGRHGANQVALAITAARFDVAVSILGTQEKDEYQQRFSVFFYGPLLDDGHKSSQRPLAIITIRAKSIKCCFKQASSRHVNGSVHWFQPEFIPCTGYSVCQQTGLCIGNAQSPHRTDRWPNLRSNSGIL